MSKSKDYVCATCGAAYRKWAGRCEACGEWNSIAEDAGLGAAGPEKKSLGPNRGARLHLADLAASEPPPARLATGIAELDRVLGGGLTEGSAILVGGDPGIGKSTLLLQAAARLAQGQRAADAGARGVAYISGEEALAQIRQRAQRLGLGDAPVGLASATNLRDILTTLDAERPSLAVIDSIQTLWSDTVESAPGSVSQVRACAHELVAFAKRRGVSVILVGHVTKDGQIAGPRVMEHMVDTVLYFEGERGHEFRILRAVKNRFGAADEIGVFEMTGAGLMETPNPSALFLSDREAGVSGSAVYAGVEGTRPVLVEVQALVAPSPLGTPRRAVIGFDQGRLSMILAVLEARCGVSLSGLDIYVNVAGGLRVIDPAADLAAAAALLSAHFDTPTPADAVVFGEVSLSGAVRPAAQAEARMREAKKLGFAQAWRPPPRSGSKTDESAPDGSALVNPESESGITATPMATLADLVDRFRA